jgi:hypothetical protein
MKRAGVITTAILFLLLATSAPAYVQHDQEGKEHDKSQKGEEHPQREQPAQHQQAQPHQQPAQQSHERPAQEEHQQPAQQQHQARQPRRQEQPQQSYGGAYHGGVQSNGPEHGGVHHSGVPQRQEQVHNGFGQSRAHAWNDDHRTWRQRGGYNGYRVPEDRFRLYFGNNHFFRIYSLPMVFVGGYPRFQYDGYWVTFADPWPEQWPETWYQTDDTYLDYTDDGYYLYNRSRPGPGIAVTINF